MDELIEQILVWGRANVNGSDGVVDHAEHFDRNLVKSLSRFLATNVNNVTIYGCIYTGYEMVTETGEHIGVSRYGHFLAFYRPANALSRIVAQREYQMAEAA